MSFLFNRVFRSIAKKCPEIESIELVISNLMIDSSGKRKPIDKMYHKYKNTDNFNGLLVWEIPMSWSNEKGCAISEKIKTAIVNQIALKRGKLPFDLYVWLVSFDIGQMIVLKKTL